MSKKQRTQYGTIEEQFRSIQASLEGPDVPWIGRPKKASKDPLPETFMGAPVISLEDLQELIQHTAQRFGGSAESRISRLRT